MVPTKAPDQAQAETVPRSAKPQPRIVWQRIVLVVCELLVLGWVARDLWQHVAAVRQHVGLPFQVDYEEGNILNALARITHGLTPYPDPHARPSRYVLAP